jgi:hypothetical protein
MNPARLHLRLVVAKELEALRIVSVGYRRKRNAT